MDDRRGPAFAGDWLFPRDIAGRAPLERELAGVVALTGRPPELRPILGTSADSGYEQQRREQQGADTQDGSRQWKGAKGGNQRRYRAVATVSVRADHGAAAL